MSKTRILFASDAHGSEICFLKFLSGWKAYKANVLILGGDLTGKMIVPIVEQPNGVFKATYFNEEKVFQKREELETFEKRVRNAGYYPFRTNPKEMEELTANKDKIDKLFSRLMMETFERWVRMAEERLKGTGVKCFIMPGNDDHLSIDTIFEKSDYVVNPEGKVVYVDDQHEMISTGYTNITPWNAPRDIPEEELAKKIEEMASQVRDMENCIFQFHCPPYNSIIDTAPKLDTSVYPFKQVIVAGQMVTIPVGSAAIRKAIEKYQPLLGLHGHIHESKGSCKIGRTLCMNPGSEYLEGILRGVLVDLDKKGMKGFLFVSG